MKVSIDDICTLLMLSYLQVVRMGTLSVRWLCCCRLRMSMRLSPVDIVVSSRLTFFCAVEQVEPVAVAVAVAVAVVAAATM
eukprot:COSAG02_NODE_662_length_18752_cov_10.146464_17_plen_81_part_00